MAWLNDEAALNFAKDFTISAIENKLIVSGENAKETAENVYDFYSVLCEKLSGTTTD